MSFSLAGFWRASFRWASEVPPPSLPPSPPPPSATATHLKVRGLGPTRPRTDISSLPPLPAPPSSSPPTSPPPTSPQPRRRQISPHELIFPLRLLPPFAPSCPPPHSFLPPPAQVSQLHMILGMTLATGAASYAALFDATTRAWRDFWWLARVQPGLLGTLFCAVCACFWLVDRAFGPQSCRSREDVSVSVRPGSVCRIYYSFSRPISRE